MRRKPRILIVITLPEIGGAQSYVRDLIPALVADYDVVVAAYGSGPLADAVLARGARYVALRHVRRPISARDILGLLELWRLFLALRPEIVHLNSSKAGILGRIAGALARVPIRVFTAHGWAFKASSGPTSRLYLWADRLVLPLTTAIVCVSETERKAGLAARTCTDDATYVIYNGVEPAGIAAERDRERVRIVSVGRLAAPKDFQTLVEAAAELDDARTEVIVLGDGPERPALDDVIARLAAEKCVILAGEVSDVPDQLLSADIFVLSSRSEGLPISVLEAMAAGLPIVASNVGGLPELVEDGVNGRLVRPGNPEDLASALAALIDDPDERARMGEASRQKAVNRFSIAACRSAHVALYDQLLRAHARSFPCVHAGSTSDIDFSTDLDDPVPASLCDSRRRSTARRAR